VVLDYYVHLHRISMAEHVQLMWKPELRQLDGLKSTRPNKRNG
jgi:hypothetical protein